MDLQIALDHRAQVEQFRHKYRTGLVTLLFTDIVGSTKLKQALGDREAVALMHHHHALVREILRQFPDGQEISTAGDSFFLVFIKPSDAVRFALLLQARLRGLNQGSSHPVLDRIGIHIGEVVIEEREGAAKPRDLYGMQVDSCARVMSLAAGNQILLTRSAFDNARQALKGEEMAGLGALSWLNHGTYQLAGVEEPVEICEVGEANLAALQQPPDSEKARRAVAGDQETVLGWRPASDQFVPNTKWMLEQKLGEGGFGEVWLGRHQTMKERRVFKFCFRADRVRSLKREMTLFRILKERVGDHPNIVRLLEVYFDEPPFYVVMDHVEGQDLKAWCEEQGGVEKVPLTARLEIVAQIADALQAAHDAGVIHRDVKPGNILVHRSSRGNEALTSSIANQQSQIENQSEPPHQPSSDYGQAGVGCYDVGVKLTDFGIGQIVSAEALAGVTNAGFTQTIVAESSSSQTGSQIYMAPELLAGKPASTRSDIYSLGVVLYQLLVGDLTRPLTTDWIKRIDDSLLRDDLARCFAGQPEERFENAGQLAKKLRELPQRQVALREQEAALAARAKTCQRWRVVRLVGVGAIILALVLTVISILNHNAKVRRARQSLPEIARLAAAEDYASAFAVAQQAERYIPNDAGLTNLWPQIAVSVSIATTPPGAEVHFKEYQKPEANWQHLGKSPVNKLRMPRGFYRWQIKKDGYDVVERAVAPTNGPMAFVLDLVGTIPPGMVRVSGGRFTPTIWGLDRLEPVELEDFLIDKFEVSNKQFKEFVDRRGYETTNYWKLPFIKDGKSISRDQAIKEFLDTTGRPGPATWSNGAFPKGQDDYPVSGVSWYEAAAYAEFVGKSLPTLFHWDKAAGTRAVAQIIPFSNFGGQGPAPVGSHQGMSPSGTFDMAGNVGEWIWNEGESGKRWIAGAAWSDPTYMFVQLDTAAPLNRAPTRGFRCMKTLSGTGPPPATVGPAIPVYHRDYKTEKPVSDDVFQSFRGYYAYDKTDLDPKIEFSDESSPHWRQEKITFNAAYGNEKVPGYLFLPKKSSPPYQTIIFFPGSNATQERSSGTHMSDLAKSEILEVILQSGRAFFYPVYKGTFERGIGLTSTRQTPTSAHRDYVIQITKDFQRSLDYLETRKDIDRDRLGYLGLSWGGRLGTLLLALEGRVKSGVFIIGGLPMGRAYPEVDQINFVTRVKIPILMLNGKYDSLFTVEASQLPMFQLLGTPEKDKRHVIYELGHQRLPRSELEKEIPSWFDRYLGPVK